MEVLGSEIGLRLLSVLTRSLIFPIIRFLVDFFDEIIGPGVHILSLLEDLLTFDIPPKRGLVINVFGCPLRDLLFLHFFTFVVLFFEKVIRLFESVFIKIFAHEVVEPLEIAAADGRGGGEVRLVVSFSVVVVAPMGVSVVCPFIVEIVVVLEDDGVADRLFGRVLEEGAEVEAEVL